MELLINEMMRHGAARSRLRAHLYGGATITAGLGAIGMNNVKFARDFMVTERISVAHWDLGGERGRRVEFRPYDGKARSSFVAAIVPTVKPPVRDTHGGDVELF
jgi:chemotaxis protein CheD